MLMPWVMLLAFFATLVLPVLGVIALVRHLRRDRSPEVPAGSNYAFSTVLDSLDQVQVRLDALSRRLGLVEEAMEREEGPAWGAGAGRRGRMAGQRPDATTREIGSADGS